MDRILIRIYTIFFAIACLILAVFVITGTGRSSDLMFAKNTEVRILPVAESMESDNSYNVTQDASEIAKAGGCLFFTTSFLDVRAYEGNVLIYENVGSGARFLRSNGNLWHFIKVSDESRTLTLNLKHARGKTVRNAPEFKAGDYYNLRSNLVVKSTPALMISILDVVFGIAMIVYFLLTRRINPESNPIFLIGVTAVLIGLWSIGETDAMVVLMTNRMLAGIFAFLILIFIPTPYVLYVHEVLWKSDKFLFRIPNIFSLINFVVVTGLALFGVLDLKQSVIITHLVWGISIIYVAVAAVNTLKNRKSINDDRASFNAYAMLLLIAVVGIELIYYWTGGRTQNDFLGRILILAYIAVLGYRSILGSLKDIERGRRAQYYKKLANTDSMTGLSNRTAFNHDVEKLSGESEYTMISIDLNNLKQVNDLKGHQTGDRYIISAAGIIEETFGREGTCYRIGGDEFSVIIKKAGTSSDIDKLIQQMEERIENYNRDNPSEPMAIAIGYESNRPDSKRGFSEILRIADEKMYENKRLKKGLSINN